LMDEAYEGLRAESQVNGQLAESVVWKLKQLSKQFGDYAHKFEIALQREGSLMEKRPVLRQEDGSSMLTTSLQSL
jgi:hypothetical protein